MTAGQKKAFDTLWPKFGLSPDEPLTDIQSTFEKPAPMILEIGFGMGDSLAQQAAAEPQYNYIGIEVHRPGVGHLLALIAAKELSNIRIYNADAVVVLNRCIPDASLAKVQIFFPDPWPKKRHHKRRLIQTPMANLICQKLIPDGLLHLATDWENYAQHMLEVLQASPLLTNTASDGPFVQRPASRPLTKFETRGQRLGHCVWDLVFRKIP